MDHLIEPAASGRAKCRGCGQKLEKGAVRFGERFPNPFGEGLATHWYHPACAAFKRPQPFLEALGAVAAALGDVAELEREARLGIEHRRVPRVDGAGRAPTGRARCRACRRPLAKQAWRIGLVFYEDGRFQPAGYVHTGCAADYFGTVALMPRIRRFAPVLNEADFTAIEAEMGTPA
jgi:hypothetical protein